MFRLASLVFALAGCGQSPQSPTDAGVGDATDDDPLARLSAECAGALSDAVCQRPELQVPNACLSTDCMDLCAATDCWSGNIFARGCHWELREGCRGERTWNGTC